MYYTEINLMFGKKKKKKTQHSKIKIMASGPMISWQVNGETMEMVGDFIFLVPITL